jgi:two-component system CheB/CheR fusion protein
MRLRSFEPYHPTSLHLVAIVAGPDDLDALKSLVGALPTGAGLSLLVVPPGDAAGLEFSSESLAEATAMVATVPENGMPLLGDRIYVLPYRAKVGIVQGTLSIESPPPVASSISPVDHFLVSFAAETGASGIAVILADSMAEGFNGLRSISTAGGKVLRHTGVSSLADLVHQVLAPEDIPSAIVSHFQASEYRQELPDQRETVLDKVMNLLIRHRGVNFSGIKRTALMRHLQARMRLLRIKNSSGYVELLRQSPEEIAALMADLQIDVTDFFRDPEAWRRLESDAIAPLIDQKRQGDPIRAWVPGCATGQDAYGLAMLLLARLDRCGKRNPVQIFATDSHEEALPIARVGRFAASIEKHIPPELLRSFFLPKDADGRYRAVDRLREVIVFGLHDVLSDPPFARLDLVVCRNLLSHLEPGKHQQVMAVIESTMNPGGILFLNSKDADLSEQPSSPFTAVARKWRIYRRNEPEIRELRQMPGGLAASPDGGEGEAAEARRVPEVTQLVQQLLLDEYTTPAVLVTERHEALYFCGPTDRFLSQPRGTPTKDILQLAREGLRGRLREALEKAAVSGLAVVEEALQVKPEGDVHPVRLTVRPLTGLRFPERLFLVVFEAVPVVAAVSMPELTDQERQLMGQMEMEYRVAAAELQIALQNLESVNQDLSISNQELMSVNEELEASREDLESLRQELQSRNRALALANGQLQDHLEKLQFAENETRTALTCAQFLAISLDHDLRLRWLSPAVIRLIPAAPADLGRPLSDLAPSPAAEGLMDDVQAALSSDRQVERHLQLSPGAVYLRRVIPFKAGPDARAGMVVTFMDVSFGNSRAKTGLNDKPNSSADAGYERHQLPPQAPSRKGRRASRSG